MEKILKQCVGLDVSSERVEAVYSVLTSTLCQERICSLTFSNSAKGFVELEAWWLKHASPDLPLYFTMEATGIYHEQLCRQVWSKPKAKVSVVLPNKAKKFAESLDGNSKTDKLDAYSLSLMGLTRELREWMPPREVTRKLRRLTRERAYYRKAETSLKNLRHALSREFGLSKASLNRIEGMIAEIRKSVTAIETEVKALVQADSELKEGVKLLTSIPGVGLLTAAVVVAETDGFQSFTSGKQLTSYVGLDVRLRESGKWKGHSKISKKGNSHIRGALYMPCVSIVRTKPELYAVYGRLTEEEKKKKMVALTALSRKLMMMMFAIWKNRIRYTENYRAMLEVSSGIA